MLIKEYRLLLPMTLEEVRAVGGGVRWGVGGAYASGVACRRDGVLPCGPGSLDVRQAHH